MLCAIGSIVERAAHVLEQHRELVAPEARNDVALTNAVLEPLHDGAEQLVAELVAERIVHRLEPVEVEEQQTHLLLAPDRARGRLLELLAQVLAIRDAGERVVAREVMQLRFGALALDRVTDRAEDHAAVTFPFDEVVLNAAIQNLDRVVLVALAAEHDHGHVRIRALDLLDAVAAARVRQMQVEQHDVEAILAQRRHGVREQADPRNVDGAAIAAAQTLTQELGVVAAILDEQDLGDCGPWHPLPPEHRQKEKGSNVSATARVCLSQLGDDARSSDVCEARPTSSDYVTGAAIDASAQRGCVPEWALASVSASPETRSRHINRSLSIGRPGSPAIFASRPAPKHFGQQVLRDRDPSARRLVADDEEPLDAFLQELRLIASLGFARRRDFLVRRLDVADGKVRNRRHLRIGASIVLRDNEQAPGPSSGFAQRELDAREDLLGERLAVRVQLRHLRVDVRQLAATHSPTRACRRRRCETRPRD